MRGKPRKIHKLAVLAQLLGVVLLGGAACTPNYNWRQLAWAQAGLNYQLPCKEERHSKTMPLLENAQTLVVEMRGCEHEGLVFAVAYAELDSPQQAASTLLRWQKAYPVNEALQIRTMLQGKKMALATVLDTVGANSKEKTQGEKRVNSRGEARQYFFDHIQWGTR